jgi:nicotinate-nucleotide pyrophosphorylase (carboxylating)
MTSLDDLIHALVRAALEEDRAADDVTTAALVPPDEQAGCPGREGERGAGRPACRRAAFAEVDAALAWIEHLEDGAGLSPGDHVATVTGSLAAILRGERVALNFVTHLAEWRRRRTR